MNANCVWALMGMPLKKKKKKKQFFQRDFLAFPSGDLEAVFVSCSIGTAGKMEALGLVSGSQRK